MIGNLFSKPTYEDLLDELEKDSFNENKAESMLKSVDVFSKDDRNRTFLHCISNKNNIQSINWLAEKGVDVNGIDKNGNTALIVASRNNAYKAVERLIELNANANIKNEKGQLAIHEALANNALSSYNLLVPITDNINDTDNDNKSVLSYIIDLNNTDLLNLYINNEKISSDNSLIFCNDIYKNSSVLKIFIEKEFDFKAVDKNNQTTLFYVIRNGLFDGELFEFILNLDIDLNHIDNFGNNILLELIQTIINFDDFKNKEKLDAFYNLIIMLMQEEVESSLRNNKGENVLSLAVKNKNIRLVKALLQNEVDPNILNDKKQSPLYIAAMIGKDVIDIVFLLLDYGADSNIRDIQDKSIIEALIEAILVIHNDKRIKINERKLIDETQDYYLILEEVLANSEANLKQLNTNKEPYFFEPLKYGNLNVLKLLIKQGSDINQPGANGLNVIYYYLANNTTFRRDIDKNNYYTNLKTIISLGADVNARDDFGGVTLHKAILDNDDNTIKILLTSGADTNAIDNRGRNILHNTMWKNKIKQFKLIYTYNKKLISTPDKFGVLPINYAAFLGYDEMVVTLMNTGSQVNNPYKKTKYILNFLERFHKNLIPLVNKTRTPTNRQKVTSLVKNMIKEFGIELSEEELEELETTI